MESAQVPSTNVSIKTQQKRDRLLANLTTAKEHQRISEMRFNMFKDLYTTKYDTYMEWCKNNNVPSFME